MSGRQWARVPASEPAERNAWLEKCKADSRPCVHVLTRNGAGGRVSISLDLMPTPLRFNAAARARVETFMKAYVIERVGAVTATHSAVQVTDVRDERAGEAVEALLKLVDLLGAP